MGKGGVLAIPGHSSVRQLARPVGRPFFFRFFLFFLFSSVFFLKIENPELAKSNIQGSGNYPVSVDVTALGSESEPGDRTQQGTGE